jgi:hypothetical protein
VVPMHEFRAKGPIPDYRIASLRRPLAMQASGSRKRWTTPRRCCIARLARSATRLSVPISPSLP